MNAYGALASAAYAHGYWMPSYNATLALFACAALWFTVQFVRHMWKASDALDEVFRLAQLEAVSNGAHRANWTQKRKDAQAKGLMSVAMMVMCTIGGTCWTWLIWSL